MQSLEKVAKQVQKSKITKKFVSVKDYKLEQDKQKGKITLNPIATHKNTIIWLHGLGDSAHGFHPIFASEYSPVTPNTKVILPTAPIRPVSINMGQPCTSWYDILSLNRNSAKDEKELYNVEQVQESQKEIESILDQEVQLVGGNYKNIYLGGFSQGGAMALYTGLQYKEELGGIFSLSGYLFESVQVKNQNQKIGLMHGKEDATVAYSYAWNSYQRLINDKNLEVKQFVEEYEGHTITEQQLFKLQDWFDDFEQKNAQ